MRRGCIAVQPVRCDGCARTMKHPERYLAIDETDINPKGTEGKLLRFCVECAKKRDMAAIRAEKGETVLTFLEEEQSKPPG